MKKRLLLLFAALGCFSTSAQIGRHTVVADLPGMFCGWCANEGGWSWDNELLVGFVAKAFKDRGDTVDGHNAVKEASEFHYLARSTDRGRHWQIEAASEFDHAEEQIPVPFETFARGEGMDFTSPGFALRCRENLFWYSHDRGATWSGPVQFPRFDSEITARTDYIVSGDSCYIFLSAKNKHQDRAFTVLATNRGRTMVNLGWIAPLYLDSLAGRDMSPGIDVQSDRTTRSVMPSTVLTADGRFITALRRKVSLDDDRPYNWIACYESTDNCRTWRYLSFVAQTDTGTRNGNPPALALSDDGKLLVCYGSRREPYGICIRASDDNGASWQLPVALRSDGRSWDLGYPQLFHTGKRYFVAVYYIATKTDRKQRIEATRIAVR